MKLSIGLFKEDPAIAELRAENERLRQQVELLKFNLSTAVCDIRDIRAAGYVDNYSGDMVLSVKSRAVEYNRAITRTELYSVHPQNFSAFSHSIMQDLMREFERALKTAGFKHWVGRL